MAGMELGRSPEVDLRETWLNETNDLLPWLSNQLWECRVVSRDNAGLRALSVLWLVGLLRGRFERG